MTFPLLLFAVVLLAVALCAIMSFAWFLWRRTGNSGWVDTVWTFGLGAVGIAATFSAVFAFVGSAERQSFILALITFWSMRLGLHIARRSAGITDDPRYAKLAEDWGDDAPRKMFWLLQMQALASLPLALAMLLAAWNPLPDLRVQDFIAVAVFAIALAGEAWADMQLTAFKSDPDSKGRICDTGLWAWSRHPNYFFQWLGWCAYPLFAIAGFQTYPWGWLALLGPLFMYWLLVYVSGIPPLEEHMEESRGQRFRDYQARTSAFFPWPPRRAGERA